MLCAVLSALVMLTACSGASEPSYLQDGVKINNEDVPYFYFNDPIEKISVNSSEVENYNNGAHWVKNFRVRDYLDGVEISRVIPLDESRQLAIPETIEGKPVIKLGGYFESDDPQTDSSFSYLSCLFGDFWESVKLPKTVKEIVNETFDEVTSLKTIEVSEDNPYYSSKDGVLYNKDRTIELCVPPGRSE